MTKWSVIVGCIALFVGGFALVRLELASHPVGGTMILVGLIVGAIMPSVLDGVFDASEEAAMQRVPAREALVEAVQPSFVRGRPMMLLRLRISDDVGQSYFLDVSESRDGERERLAQAGRSIWVRVHPTIHDKVQIDWEQTRFREPARTNWNAARATIPQVMSTVTLTCTSCGAKLQLAGRISVVCNYCHTENHVVRS